MNKTPLLFPVFIAFTALACQGTTTRMQIVDPPVYVCPTATARSTDIPSATQVQPPIIIPASGWATLTPVPGCIWDGRVCATNTPYPGGLYSTPGFTQPSATSTPRSTTTPYPTPTPFVLRPPQDFFAGDAVYTTGETTGMQVRLRLLNIHLQPATPALDGSVRSLVLWTLEVKNVGSQPYELFPAWQMYIRTVETASGDLEGIWGASSEAAAEAGLNRGLEAITLRAGETRRFTLAAYIPVGTPARFAFALDPTMRETPDAPGTNLLTWTADTNPYCAGDIAEPPMLPTRNG